MTNLAFDNTAGRAAPLAWRESHGENRMTRAPSWCVAICGGHHDSKRKAERSHLNVIGSSTLTS